jgi:hypothetical protein
VKTPVNQTRELLAVHYTAYHAEKHRVEYSYGHEKIKTEEDKKEAIKRVFEVLKLVLTFLFCDFLDP